MASEKFRTKSWVEGSVFVAGVLLLVKINSSKGLASEHLTLELLMQELLTVRLLAKSFFC